MWDAVDGIDGIEGATDGGARVSGGREGVVASIRWGREEVYVFVPDEGERELVFSAAKSAKRDVKC
jgi:hypothetical protein